MVLRHFKFEGHGWCLLSPIIEVGPRGLVLILRIYRLQQRCLELVEVKRVETWFTVAFRHSIYYRRIFRGSRIGPVHQINFSYFLPMSWSDKFHVSYRWLISSALPSLMGEMNVRVVRHKRWLTASGDSQIHGQPLVEACAHSFRVQKDTKISHRARPLSVLQSGYRNRKLSRLQSYDSILRELHPS